MFESRKISDQERNRPNEMDSVIHFQVCAYGHCSCNTKPSHESKCSRHGIPKVRVKDKKQGQNVVKGRKILREYWIRFIRQSRKDFTDKKITHAWLCGCHFIPEMFDPSQEMRRKLLPSENIPRRLIPEAYPSIKIPTNESGRPQRNYVTRKKVVEVRCNLLPCLLHCFSMI